MCKERSIFVGKSAWCSLWSVRHAWCQGFGALGLHQQAPETRIYGLARTSGFGRDREDGTMGLCRAGPCPACALPVPRPCLDRAPTMPRPCPDHAPTVPNWTLSPDGSDRCAHRDGRVRWCAGTSFHHGRGPVIGGHQANRGCGWRGTPRVASFRRYRTS